MVRVSPGDTFVCFVDPLVARDFDLSGNNVRVVEVPVQVPPTDAASARSSRSVSDMVRFTRAVRREPLDVFFSPSVYTYFPLPPGLPAAVTIHDAIAERFPELTLPSRRARLFWRAKVRLAVLQARLILTVSEYSAQELATVLGIPPRDLRVVLEAPSASYRPSESSVEIANMARRIGLPENSRWFVYVGGFNPHKRLDVVVRAHAELVHRLGEASPYLVLVGAAERDRFHKDTDSIQRLIAEVGTGRFVRWTGFLPDEELRHLHSGSLGLILVSESEGFGLPAVEAAACGSAVVATRESPLPTLLAEGGLFVTPGDVGALTAALAALESDEKSRRVMGQCARLRACGLTWERTAQATLDALREAAFGRPTPRTPQGVPVFAETGV